MSYGIRSAHNDFQIYRPITQVWQALYFEYHVDYDIVTVGDYHVQEPLYGLVTQNLNHYPEVEETELDTGENCHVANKAEHVVDCCDAQAEVEYCYDAEAPVSDVLRRRGCGVALLHFSEFLCISLHFSTYLCMPLHCT